MLMERISILEERAPMKSNYVSKRNEIKRRYLKWLSNHIDFAYVDGVYEFLNSHGYLEQFLFQ